MIKAIYVQRRKPGMTREQFVRRWRGHGSFAMGFPDFFWPCRQICSK
ncbi:MAG: hypothetical protein WDN03_07210 [Rhizomicrobium sp.]